MSIDAGSHSTIILDLVIRHSGIQGRGGQIGLVSCLIKLFLQVGILSSTVQMVCFILRSQSMTLWNWEIGSVPLNMSTVTSVCKDLYTRWPFSMDSSLYLTGSQLVTHMFAEPGHQAWRSLPLCPSSPCCSLIPLMKALQRDCLGSQYPFQLKCVN